MGNKSSSSRSQAKKDEKLASTATKKGKLYQLVEPIKKQTPLTFSEIRSLSSNVSAYMVDDGTIFYYEPSAIPRLYVDWKGKVVEAKLQNGGITNIVAHGNAIYFTPCISLTDFVSVQKAVLTKDGNISITRAHKRMLPYSNESSPVYIKIHDGSKYAYRFWEYERKCAVLIDVPNETMKQLRILGIQRGKLICVSEKMSYDVSVQRISVNVVVIWAPLITETPNIRNLWLSKTDQLTTFSTFSISRDSSPFFYFFIRNWLFALNTETMVLLERLQHDYITCEPKGIRSNNDILLEVAQCENETYAEFFGITPRFRKCIVTARLPDDYLGWREVKVEENDALRAIMQNDVVKFTSNYFMSWIFPEHVLGVGSFGCVVKAKHKADEKRYALKIISLKSSVELDKTLSEVSMMRKLQHPGIVGYQNAWMEKISEKHKDVFSKSITHFEEISKYIQEQSIGVFLFIQMELCSETLAEWLIRNKDIRELNKMKSWFKQIICALEYIHSKNIIHRDLKPSNILVASEDTVKICDLGIATDCVLENSEIWRTNIGTEMYKAPEQNFIYDRRVDIFAAGLILVEMCSVMSTDKKIEVLNDIRSGKKPKNVLNNQSSTMSLVRKLTKIDREQRPSFDEIHKHKFFSKKSLFCFRFSSY